LQEYQNIFTGILSAAISVAYGVVYLLLKRNVRYTYPVFLSIALPLVMFSPWVGSLPIPGALRITIIFFLYLVPCFAVILIKQQGFSSIGFHTKNLLPALCLGIVFSVFSLVFTYQGILPGLLTGGQFQTFGILMTLLLSTVLNAAWEDIAITGYVQTRLYGLIKMASRWSHQCDLHSKHLYLVRCKVRPAHKLYITLFAADNFAHKKSGKYFLVCYNGFRR
jgi:hypothetical protein